MASFAIGVDLGGTNLRVAAVDNRGVIMEKITTGTEVARPRDQVLDEMCNAISDLAAKFSDANHLAGIGVGIPGIIDMHTGMLHESPNLPGWQDYPVRNEMERRLGTTVILENDANAAALGEKWLGAGSDSDDLCMLTLGTGVGGGLVLGGKIWHGMTGMAGELGHITVDPNGVECGCGNRGCLEQYASATAIKRMAMEAIANGEAPELAYAMNKNPEFSAKLVYELADQGDQPAQQIFRKVGQALGVVLASLVNTFNLRIYVIGGGVSSAWKAFAPSMLEEVRKRSFVYVATTPTDVPAKPRSSGWTTVITHALLGSDAGLIGAARLPMVANGVRLQEEELRQV
jgi:glucokinase